MFVVVFLGPDGMQRVSANAAGLARVMREFEVGAVDEEPHPALIADEVAEWARTARPGDWLDWPDGWVFAVSEMEPSRLPPRSAGAEKN